MQFVSDGPDVPNDLLQAHEEGRVIFFCGAGISYPAGLPGFKGLVDKIYESIGTDKKSLELRSYENEQYDVTLDLLEGRITGSRETVRNALKNSLKPDLSSPESTKTHESLIKLATDNQGSTRIVTTNFDQIFDEAANRIGVTVNAFSAPMLPIPKRSRWNGLVYLHGLLPDSSEMEALNRLVVTSGDFGLAYLTERWAARFVSELFKNFVVCFVGYSINDPVLRYMMDALAADRMLGEKTDLSYAFGSYDGDENKELSIKEWEAKGVVPVLFDKNHGHSKLHETLEAWANMYHDGITGKESIVAQNALALPTNSTPQDNFVERVVWALTDSSGRPAKRFSELSPTPVFDWLEHFNQNNFKFLDLQMFGITPDPHKDKDVEFSLINRPVSHHLSTNMSLFSLQENLSNWDGIMTSLAIWLSYHLNNPDLIIWLARNGAKLNYNLISIIEDRLEYIGKLQIKSDQVKLDEIEKKSPNGIPSKMMKTLWELFLTNKVETTVWVRRNLYSWAGKINNGSLTPALRFEFRKILEPKIRIEKPYSYTKKQGESAEAERISDLVRWELTLAEKHAKSGIEQIDDDILNQILPQLFSDIQQLLLDALDLKKDLGGCDNHHDNSYFDLPSISGHFQNRHLRSWVLLIELLRDSWSLIVKENQVRGSEIAESWFAMPYPVFKRLALFAASHENVISSEIWTNWLIQDNSRWLWSPETQRETMRLMVLRGQELTADSQYALEKAILAGLPRDMFNDDITEEELNRYCDRGIWLHLAKLEQGGVRLSELANNKYKELSEAYPDWKLSRFEKEEFPYWMSGTGDPDYEESQKIDLIPRKTDEIIEWLKQPKERDSLWFYRDDWEEACKRRPLHILCALSSLSKQKKWPIDKWNETLNTWSRNLRIPVKLWNAILDQLNTMPDEVLLDISHSLGWLIEKLSKNSKIPELEIIQLSEKLLNLQEHIPDFELQEGIISQAINHSIGHLTQGLINVWFRRSPQDNECIPELLSNIFTRLLNTQSAPYILARVILSSQLIALFRVDPEWTRNNVLHLFDWSISHQEAEAVWQGFLMSPRIYAPLLILMKENLLLTAEKYEYLDNYNRQFAAFLTYVSLNNPDGFSSADFRHAIENLPLEGVEEVADTLYSAFSSSGDKKAHYLENRILPFWREVWPKSDQYKTLNVSEALAKLCLEANEDFPKVFSELRLWIIPVNHPDYIVHLLHDKNLHEQFPEDSLDFLNRLISEQYWKPRELKDCLDVIIQKAPSLANDPRHRRLSAYLQQTR